MKWTIYFSGLLILISCQNLLKNNFDESTAYNFSKPEKYWEMPYELREISGIDTINAHQLIAHNDEKGDLYIYDLKHKSIKKTIPFGKNGDYEDVVIVGKTAYVLQSNGTLFQVENFLESPKTIVHKTFLSNKDDVEGLCFDKKNNQLLLATKGHKSNKIYAFSIKNNALNSQAVFEIDSKDLKKKYKIKKDFSPSAIAIHPKTKHYFVLSSIGKMIAEFNRQGKLLHVFNINYSHFGQPEGICFSENGDLYIANEANVGKANILKFNYLQ
ncbi:MAG: hypothetical protein COZ17_06000 [Flavobacteriaceae bacterium CG_4_10_14_3_um_filter_33_47]|nr:MAG: hypothetical protein COZ17_06000 [Flavobacteriaceae bacterium CG_4_10_14_3_um_filter_33_47]PJB16954.1 MAG: hypothetical protein CO117_13480 [Flavobacteriaceae bacterium CG_4_9_14_3_um_filter_33_16]